jgi:hypothetical protein
MRHQLSFFMKRELLIATLAVAGSGSAWFYLSNNNQAMEGIDAPISAPQAVRGNASTASSVGSSAVIPPAVVDQPSKAVWHPVPSTSRISQSTAVTAAAALHPTRNASTQQNRDPYRIYRVIEEAVDGGKRLPASVLGGDLAVDLSGQQEIALSEIEKEFIAGIYPIVDPTVEEGQAPRSPDEIWEKAQSNADSRYRLLFGDAAYNTQGVQGATQALGGR